MTKSKEEIARELLMAVLDTYADGMYQKKYECTDDVHTLVYSSGRTPSVEIRCCACSHGYIPQ